jgi:hypothetical protein
MPVLAVASQLAIEAPPIALQLADHLTNLHNETRLVVNSKTGGDRSEGLSGVIVSECVQKA